MARASVTGGCNVGTPGEGLLPSKSLAGFDFQDDSSAELSSRAPYSTENLLPIIIPTSYIRSTPFMMKGFASTRIKARKPYVGATLAAVLQKTLDNSSDEEYDEVEQSIEDANKRTPRAMAPSPESFRGLTPDEIDAVIGLQKLRPMSLSTDTSALSSMASEDIGNILEDTPPPVRKIKPLKKKKAAKKSSKGKGRADNDEDAAQAEDEEHSEPTEILPDGTYRPTGLPDSWTRQQWDNWVSQSPSPYPPLTPTPTNPEWTAQQHWRLDTYLHRLENDTIRKTLNLAAPTRLCPLPSLNNEPLPTEKIGVDMSDVKEVLKREVKDENDAWLSNDEIVRDLVGMGFSREEIIGMGYGAEVGERRASRRVVGGRLQKENFCPSSW